MSQAVIDFTSLGLAAPILRAIHEAGYTTPTPIQAQAIPQVLAGGDLLAAAQTGTGKTAGFTLPLLHRLMDGAPSKPSRPRCLILTPTRELAAQVEESVKTYGKHLPLTSMVMFGGVSINPQIAALKRRVDILVATPGRLLDHVSQKTLDLSGVEILVLDEADRMLDMGFIHDIRKVLALLPKQRQNLLFSATFSDEIRTLANGLLKNPQCIEVARRNTTTELVTQRVALVPQKQKRELLAWLIKENDWHQVLVFTRMKHGANRLAEYFEKRGIGAMAIHGNKSQNARTKALAQFKDGSLPVLVATDIAARGLDIDQLPHVVNFELPNVPEDYVHRIGRTGRAGAEGEALSLVDSEEMKYLADIERLIKRKIDRVSYPDFVPAPAAEGHADQGDARPPREQNRGRRSDAPRGGGERAKSGARPAAKRPEANGNVARPQQGQARSGNTANGRGPAPAPRAAKPAAPRAPQAQRPASAPRPANGNRAAPQRAALFAPRGTRAED